MTNEHGLQYECDETAQALRLWKAVQDGTHKVVPVEATERMYQAGLKLSQQAFLDGYQVDEEGIYKAMLDAAPAWEVE